MPLILGAQSAVSTGFTVDNCSRWNDQGRMERNFTAGDPDTWTFSCWFKGGPWTSGYPKLLQGVDPAVAADNADTSLQLNTSDKITFTNWNSGYDGQRITTQVVRDVGAWYHIVFVYDSGNGTPADRIKMYLNGVQITAFTTEGNPDADQDSNFNKSSPQCEFHLGSHFGRDSGRWKGYMAEVAYVDGTVYSPSDFGEFNTDSPTIWQPKDFSGDITFGTNGLYLDFADSANLGADVSGNGNDLTEANFTAADQGTDSPTNNFCTMNPLDNFYVAATWSEGNNQLVIANGIKTYATSTMGVSAGKWYWETKMSANTGSDTDEQSVGIADRVSDSAAKDSYAVDYPANYIYQSQGRFVESETTNTNSCPDSYTTGDIMMVALDLVNDKLYFGKNGTWQCSGDPTSGATGTGAEDIKGTADADTSGFYFPMVSSDTTSRGATWQFNFGGCSAFDVASANQDGNGYGNFEYAVPSGYLAICTKNLGSDGG